jgi:type IV pilus assembly protein PilE
MLFGGLRAKNARVHPTQLPIQDATRMKGFHLIEILITLSIIGILSMIALPIYSQYFTKLKRLDAIQILTKLSMNLEEYYLRHHTYENANLDILHIPEWIDNYQLIIANTTLDDYEIMAKPSIQQAEKDAVCGTLILSATGEKSVSGTGKVEDCW